MILVAYLVGSIPASIIAVRLFAGIDVRDLGSGNAGATNAARVLGWRGGLAVAAFDVAKGVATVLLVSRIAPLAASASAAAALCGLAAVVGHALPVAYLVSRVLGAAADRWTGGFCLAVFLVVVVTHRRNIGRLLRGEEPRTTFGRRQPS
jgi:glycerol-3-phosphate acyltransferase PlsY